MLKPNDVKSFLRDDCYVCNSTIKLAPPIVIIIMSNIRLIICNKSKWNS